MKRQPSRHDLPCRAVFLDKVNGRVSIRRGKYPEKSQRRTERVCNSAGWAYTAGPVLWFEDDDAAQAVFNHLVHTINKAGIEIEVEHRIPYVRNSLAVLEHTLRFSARVCGCSVIPRNQAASLRGFVNARVTSRRLVRK